MRRERAARYRRYYADGVRVSTGGQAFPDLGASGSMLRASSLSFLISL